MIHVQSRRSFLRNSFALGCCAGMFPTVPSISLASAPTDKRLVVIILRGGMDGLDVVRPTGDSHFKDYRPNTFDEARLELDSFYSLHPSLQGLWDLWNQGELAVGQAVSTPYRNKRSHFDGQALLETGVLEAQLKGDSRSGWLNRALQLMPDTHSKTALGVGLDHFLILEGDADYSKWYPGRHIGMTPQSQRLLEHVSERDPLFHAALTKAIALSDGGAAFDTTHNNSMMTFGGENDGKLEQRMNARALALSTFTAKALSEETRLATFSLDGWDTHCLLYTSPSPRDGLLSRMPSSA